MGAPALLGFSLVRTTNGKVRLLSSTDPTNAGHSLDYTEFDCESSLGAIAAEVQSLRERLDHEVEKQRNTCIHESSLTDSLAAVDDETLYWRASAQGLKIPTTPEEIDALPLRTVGGYVTIQFGSDGRSLPTEQDLLVDRWRVVEIVEDPHGAPLHEVVITDELTFVEAWEIATHYCPLDPAEPRFRPWSIQFNT